MERPLNHHYREPGTEHGSGRLTKEQEAHAAKKINQGIEAALTTESSIDASTARLIAAALHSGVGSHLEQFAATGALNPAGALDELEDGGQVELHHIPWCSALWDFLEQIQRPEPDRVEVEHQEPDPLIYVQAVDLDLGLRNVGAWLNPTIPTAELTEQMREVADLVGVDNATTAVTASVGFHQLSLPPDISASDVAVYARGIAEHGEPYALLATHEGTPVSEDYFLDCHLGSYSSMSAFIGRTPETTLEFIRETSGIYYEDRVNAFDDFEAFLRRYYLCLDGRDSVHVFHRVPILLKGGA